MNVRVDQAGPCRREVHIEVPVDRVRGVFEEVLKAYSQIARLPGFRPGKVPRDMVRRRFQKEITSEVKDRLIPAAYQEAVRQEKLETVAILEVKEKTLADNQPFAFSITVDVQPSFALPTYKGLAVERHVAALEDKDVDDVLRNVREQNARFEESSGRAVQQGDLAQLDFTGTVDGQPVEALAPKAKGMGEGKDFWLMADSENEFLPGFAAGVVGAQVGETRAIEVSFPADFIEPALQGKRASYSVTVKAVREKKIPTLDEAFLKGLGVESESQLRERIRGDLMNMREENEKRRQQNEVAGILLNSVQLDLPESIVQEETRQQVFDMVRNNQSRGVSKEDIETRKEELFDAATRSASDKLKLRYILRAIARQEKITIEDVEVEQRVAQMARSWGMTTDKVKAELQKNNAMVRVRDDALLNKTLAWVLDQANITAKA